MKGRWYMCGVVLPKEVVVYVIMYNRSRGDARVFFLILFYYYHYSRLTLTGTPFQDSLPEFPIR